VVLININVRLVWFVEATFLSEQDIGSKSWPAHHLLHLCQTRSSRSPLCVKRLVSTGKLGTREIDRREREAHRELSKEWSLFTGEKKKYMNADSAISVTTRE
jgi:hypothetical protein